MSESFATREAIERPSTASVTTTTTITSEERPEQTVQPGGVLKLRGAPRSQRKVTWTEEVVDNEGLGRKKTKICCIYHKPREFGESSSEEDSSSSSDGEGANSDTNDSDQKDSSSKTPCSHRHNRQSSQKGKRRKNAYEKSPQTHKQDIT